MPKPLSMALRHARLLLLVLLTLAVAGCWKQSGTKETTFHTGAAIDALLDGIELARGREERLRSAPLMGVYSALFLSANAGIVPVASAKEGVLAQVRYHSRPTEERLENLFELLQEFGSVLQVDVNDMLNRSDNRAETLNTYLEGLRNITARSEKKNSELGEYIKILKEDQRAERKIVTTLSKAARDATRANDFVTAGEKQQEQAEAEKKLAELNAELNQQDDLSRTFEKFIELAKKRADAIDKNREILIAGLTVESVPGIESLGIIEGKYRGNSYKFGQ